MNNYKIVLKNGSSFNVEAYDNFEAIERANRYAKENNIPVQTVNIHFNNDYKPFGVFELGGKIDLLETHGWSGLKDIISDVKHNAKKEAKAHCSCVRSRGTYVFMANTNKPNPYITSADCVEFPATKKDWLALKERLFSEYPDANIIDLEGGFNGADDVAQLNGDDYFPWVSAWALTIWKK